MARSCLSFVPTMFGAISLLFGLTGGSWCRLVYKPVDRDLTLNTAGFQPSWVKILPEAEFGLFQRRTLDITGFAADPTSVFITYQDTCTDYFDLKAADSWWTASIICQVLSWTFAFAFTASIAISVCFLFPPFAYRLIGLGFIGTGILQGMVFLVLNSNLCTDNPQLRLYFSGTRVYKDYCELSTGAKLCIVAVIGYVLTGCMCCCLSRAIKDDDSLTKDEPPTPTSMDEDKCDTDEEEHPVLVTFNQSKSGDADDEGIEVKSVEGDDKEVETLEGIEVCTAEV